MHDHLINIYALISVCFGSQEFTNDLGNHLQWPKWTGQRLHTRNIRFLALETRENSKIKQNLDKTKYTHRSWTQSEYRGVAKGESLKSI